jgi:hypothetical protein
MRQFMRIFDKVPLTLAAVVVLLAAVPVQATPAVSGPGPLLLAQKAEPKPEKAPCCPTPPPKEPGPTKSMAPPPPQMEQMRTRGIKPGNPLEGPAASGTKKMGGQTIRAKEAPTGE